MVTEFGIRRGPAPGRTSLQDIDVLSWQLLLCDLCRSSLTYENNSQNFPRVFRACCHRNVLSGTTCLHVACRQPVVVATCLESLRISPPCCYLEAVQAYRRPFSWRSPWSSGNTRIDAQVCIRLIWMRWHCAASAVKDIASSLWYWYDCCKMRCWSAA